MRQPPGLTALGCQGSACDRLRLTGRLRAFAQGSYEVSLRWRGGRHYGRHFLCRLWRRKPDNRASPAENHTTALRARKGIPPLVAGATTLTGGKHVTGFAGRLQLPYEFSFFATPAVRLVNQKEGPFMGRLRAYFDQLAHPMQDVHSGTITRAYCRAIYEESVSRCFILSPGCGKVPRSRIGGGERSEPVSRMLIMPYDTESKSRNADFISIARRAIHNPRGQRPRQT